MKVNGRHFESLWIHPKKQEVLQIIDQRYLPFALHVEDIATAEEMERAIRDMHLRGAPLIGVAGAWAMYLTLLHADPGGMTKSWISTQAMRIKSARPTAVNLAWAVDRIFNAVENEPDPSRMVETARRVASEITQLERERSRMIGLNGLPLLEQANREKRGAVVNILTHCNAGWLACVDYGTALAPIYLAHDRGIPLHIWVDETRPRNQGAHLTAWELAQHGVPCTVITDNAGGYLMMKGKVDMVLVGCDRASPYGDIVNKVGTYLKALAAYDNHIPFYAALPTSTIDWNLEEGAVSTPIEEREGAELRSCLGWDGNQFVEQKTIPDNTAVSNVGFDITPARLVSAIITEKGIFKANYHDLATIYPNKT
jgi:methylthioribose-1-phosphate isomerase